MLPILSLRGVSTGDVQEALNTLLGKEALDRVSAEAAMGTFEKKYAAKYAKAVQCLTRDREALLAFYDFPAEHWDHVRTTNPSESVFATVRHRTVRTKGALSQEIPKLMVFKLITDASKTWRCLQGENQLPKVIQGPHSATALRSPSPRHRMPPDQTVTQFPA